MKRILTAAVLVPTFLWVVLAAPAAAFAVALVAVAGLCFYEYSNIAARHLEDEPNLAQNPIGYGAGLVLLFLPGQEVTFLVLVAVVVMIQSLRADSLRQSLPRASFILLGVIYCFGAWRCAAGLRSISPWWLLFALAINWVGDTFAYYFGRMLGRHKLAPRVSPGKSWEGTIASLAGTLVLGVFYLHQFLPNVGIVQAVALCLCGNMAGQLGDLCESAFKRGAGVKDSGTLLPGHGGWLDRVDSSMFSLPVVYWLVEQPWFFR